MLLVKYWQTRSFKKLEKAWNRKLRNEGFEDAERIIDSVHGHQRRMTQRASNAYRQASEIERNNKSDYYRLLGLYTHDEEFTDQVDLLVMFWRSQAYKISRICEELELLGHRCHRQTVRFIIRKYEHKWAIKRWTPSQLDPPWKRWKKALTG